MGEEKNEDENGEKDEWSEAGRKRSFDKSGAGAKEPSRGSKRARDTYNIVCSFYFGAEGFMVWVLAVLTCKSSMAQVGALS